MPHQKLPTATNVQKVIKNLQKSDGIIYLKGQVLHERDDTDVELPFRQESNFFYMTGMSCIFQDILYVRVF
jgi:Xaa-Pro dipeptidase